MHAWTPAFDNYDGAEKFWLRYELSLLTDTQKLEMYDKGYIPDYLLAETNWLYVWSVVIYYSLLVLGGNEMQPAQ